MLRSTTLLGSLIYLLIFESVQTFHVRGVWHTGDMMTVVAKFAFQRTDPMQPKETRGYVYGNVTYKNDRSGSTVKDASSTALLALVNFEHFQRIYAHRDSINDDAKFCSVALKASSEVAFDARCSPLGKQDFFRKVPCSTGSLCAEEDDPENVVRGHQLTYQVQDKAQARFWFVLLLNCRLDANCNWTSGSIDDNGNKSASFDVDYDLWLVNGEPRMKHYNPFEHQFSFDQMDTLEIFVVALVVNLILIGLQWRAFITYRSKRGKLLIIILCVQCTQIASNLVHVGAFAVDGQGVRTFRIIGDLLEMVADFALIFLLICIAKGWTITKPHVPDRYKLFLMSVAFCVLSVIFYIWSYNAVDDLLDIDVFQTWPGWGLLTLRIIAMAWFLVELRRSVRAEYDDTKVSFLLHFGAGFLVWFIYLPVLGALSSQIALMWRYKVVLSIAYLADFVACAVLIHLFWPSSSNRTYFLNNASSSAAAEELDDYEKAIIMDDLEGIKHVDESPRVATLNGQTPYDA